MELENINKLIRQRYQSPDNIIGKKLMFKKFPELKKHLRRNDPESFRLEKEILTTLGIESKKGFLDFNIMDFPELFD